MDCRTFKKHAPNRIKIGLQVVPATNNAYRSDIQLGNQGGGSIFCHYQFPMRATG